MSNSTQKPVKWQEVTEPCTVEAISKPAQPEPWEGGGTPVHFG